MRAPSRLKWLHQPGGSNGPFPPADACHEGSGDSRGFHPDFMAGSS